MLIDLKPIDMALLVTAAVTALTVPFLAARWSRSGVHWGPGIALGVGYFAFQYAMARPGFPPMDVADRIVWLGLASMILGLFESIAPGPAWTRWENRLLMTALILGAMLGPILGEDRRADVLRLAGASALFLNGWAHLEGLAARANVRVLGPVMLAAGGGTAGVLVSSGWLVGGILAGGLTIAAGLTWVVSWFTPGLSFQRGAVPVIVTILGTVLLNGFFYSSTPLSSALLIAVAPVAAWAGWIGPARKLRPWQSALVGLAVVLIPVGLAIGLAVAASPSLNEM